MLIILKAFIFLLVLAHVIVLFASAVALALFIVKRLAIGLWRICTAKRVAQKPAAPRKKLYTGPLTGPATVHLPQSLRN